MARWEREYQVGDVVVATHPDGTETRTFMRCKSYRKHGRLIVEWTVVVEAPNAVELRRERFKDGKKLPP